MVEPVETPFQYFACAKAGPCFIFKGNFIDFIFMVASWAKNIDHLKNEYIQLVHCIRG